MSQDMSRVRNFGQKWTDAIILNGQLQSVVKRVHRVWIEKQKIILGGSSGINIAGAIKLAKQMGDKLTTLFSHRKLDEAFAEMYDKDP